jgi:hypothetical protein
VTGSLHILHLEDDSNDAELVRAALDAEGIPCEVERASSRGEFVAALDRRTPDLILSDFSLPGFDGAAAIMLAREKAPGVPFILVSGTLGEESAIESLQGGATDYVLKQRLTRLVPAVRRAIQEAEDRSKRVQAAEALADRQQFLNALLDSIDAGIVACDASGAFTLFNRAAREMHGIPGGQASVDAPERHYGLFGPDGKKPLAPGEHPLTRALRGEKIRNEEIVIVPGNAPPRTVLVSGQHIVGASGRDLGAVVAMHDITDRKLLEAQLRQAQKMEAVGLLAGGVAHDFNNLLTAIIGYNQLMAARLKPGDPFLRDTEEIAKATTRATMLTRQLLTFSRREVVQPRILNVSAVVDDMGKMLHRLIGEDIELVLVKGQTLGAVRADPGHIEQVILNLVVNARDAMPRGGRISIETSNVEIGEDYRDLHPGVSSGRYVLLAVSDTGTGMDEETKARIFEPFFTTKGPEKGTGLGLSTVYGIVQQWGGTIQVYSDIGWGTTFKVYFPMEGSSATPEARDRPDETLPTGKETVLVVEDQEPVAAVMRAILTRCGYAVLEARHGRDALRAFEETESPIQLLITDVVMPVMGGPELAERVWAKRPKLRVLFTSGYTERGFTAHESLDPRASFLPKPFQPVDLARAVRRALDGQTSPSGR